MCSIFTCLTKAHFNKSVLEWCNDFFKCHLHKTNISSVKKIKIKDIRNRTVT